MVNIVPPILLLLSFSSLILNVSLVNCTLDTDFVMPLCSYTNFDEKSSYENNLFTLLSNLSLNSNQSSNNGYYATNTSSLLGGRSMDTEIIYGLYICRGDIPSKECNGCVSLATKNMPPVKCPTDKSAVIWYNKCMVRYSNVSFLGIVDEFVHLNYTNMENVTSDTLAYTNTAGDALQSLATLMSNPSAMTGDKRYFGTQVTQVKNSIVSVYTMVQCTPDLTPSDCQRCLQIIINEIPNSCGGSNGCRMLNPSCNLRYEQYSFSELPMAPPPSALSSSPSLAVPSSIGNFSTLPTGVTLCETK